MPFMIMLLMLAAETPKVEPAKPRTAPLPELVAVKLQRDDAQSELLKAQFMQIQQRRQAAIDEACKAAGFAKCTTDGQTLTEVPPEPKK